MRFGTLLVVGLIACGCAGRSALVPTIETAATTPAASATEITAALGRDEIVTLRIGQILRVPTPDADRRWRIDYAAAVLTPLTPAAEMSRPASGWRFRAAAAGETDVAATAVAEPGEAAPPAPLRFSVTIKVQPTP